MGTRVAASPTRRHGRRWAAVSLTLVALVAISGLVLSLAGCGSGTTAGTGSAVASLPARTVEAGPITVKLEPRQFDAAGAVFKITFDTHSAELGQDLARQSRLVVGDTPWPVAAWSGDGPGGHHREGELRFTAAGPVAGTVTLNIDGLPEPVTVTWDAGS